MNKAAKQHDPILHLYARRARFSVEANLNKGWNKPSSMNPSHPRVDSISKVASQIRILSGEIKSLGNVKKKPRAQLNFTSLPTSTYPPHYAIERHSPFLASWSSPPPSFLTLPGVGWNTLLPMSKFCSLGWSQNSSDKDWWYVISCDLRLCLFLS